MFFSAKLSICSAIFLTTLYFTQQFDLALSLSLISAFVLFNLASVYLFILSIIFFVIFLIFQKFYISLDFVGDLSVSSYLLFLAFLVISLWWSEEKRSEIVSVKFVKELISQEKKGIKLGLSLFIVLLLYPLIGAHSSVVIGFISFLIIFDKFKDSRYAFGLALFFLAFCPFLLIAEKDETAGTYAVFTYYFLVVGVIQEIINIIRSPKKEEMLAVRKVKDEKLTLRSEKIRQMKIQSEKFQGIKIEALKIEASGSGRQDKKWLYFAAGGFLFLIAVFVVVCISFGVSTKMPRLNFLAKKKIEPTTVSPLVTLVPTVSPAVIPSSILEVSTESAKLKIFVQNGTEITGLAASTSAKLKKAGFTNIKIGNAETQDYTNWQLTTKKEVPDLSSLFKNILELSDLQSKEATIPAGFDILIIAGFNK